MIKGSGDKSSCSGVLAVFNRLGQGTPLGAGCWEHRSRVCSRLRVLLTAALMWASRSSPPAAARGTGQGSHKLNICPGRAGKEGLLSRGCTAGPVCAGNCFLPLAFGNIKLFLILFLHRDHLQSSPPGQNWGVQVSLPHQEWLSNISLVLSYLGIQKSGLRT